MVRLQNKYKASTSLFLLAVVRKKFNGNGKDENTVIKITDYWKAK